MRTSIQNLKIKKKRVRNHFPLFWTTSGREGDNGTKNKKRERGEREKERRREEEKKGEGRERDREGGRAQKPSSLRVVGLKP